MGEHTRTSLWTEVRIMRSFLILEIKCLRHRQINNFTHSFTAGVSPLYLFQLPSYCGYNVRVTWRDLVLMAPFDGCYITQEVANVILIFFNLVHLPNLKINSERKIQIDLSKCILDITLIFAYLVAVGAFSCSCLLMLVTTDKFSCCA